MIQRCVSRLALLGPLVSLGCGGSGNATAPLASTTGDAGSTANGIGFDAAAAAELHAKHVDKYVGKITLTNTSTNAAGDTVYTFDPSEGPECYLGAQYSVSMHYAGSENLLIYLQGGGACWTDLCAATPTGDPTIPPTGILDQDAAKNPVGDWNIVYAPYCDGSVFSGDNDMTGPQGEDWHFHGLANLTAAVDVAKKAFPNPKRILLAGSSAGGYGTLTGTGVVRLEYPTTKLDVFNDAGLGLSNPNNATMLPDVKRDWKFDQFLPDSCTECKTGMETSIVAWGMQHDPSLRASGFSSYNDAVIGGVFLGLSGPDFKALLLSETDKIHSAFPDRFERFFINGSQHTVLLVGSPGYYDAVDGLSVADFLRDELSGSPAWVDHMQQ